MLRVLLFAFSLFAAVSSRSVAQTYPEQPVRLVIGFAAGSGPDLQGRTVAVELGKLLGQQFYVENRLGANGTIAARTVAQSKPDGYSLLFTSSSIASTPYIYKNLGFDLLNDLRAVATVGELDGLFLLVDAKSPIKTVQDVIERAKADRVLYGSPGVGNGLHLAAEMFAKSAGIKLQHVPYKGGSEVMTGMLTGSIDMMLATPPAVQGLLREGRIRALAFTGSKPFPAFPEVPLLKDIVPGYRPQGSWGLFLAPAKTQEPVLHLLNSAIQKAVQAPEVAAVLRRDGYLPDNRDLDGAAAFFRKEVMQAEDAVKAAGIEPN